MPGHVAGLVHCPHPLQPARNRRIICSAAADGEDLLAYLHRHDVRPLPGRDRVTVNGQTVDAEHWGAIQPGRQAQVIVTAVVSGGGGGRKLARTLLQIAVLATALHLPGALGITSTLGTGLISAGIAVGGSLVIDAIAPLPVVAAPTAEGIEAAPASLTAGRGQVRHYQPMPLVLGTHRVFGEHAQLPYLRGTYRGGAVGLATPTLEVHSGVDDVEIRSEYALTLGGVGPVDIQDERLGTTPIACLGPGTDGASTIISAHAYLDSTSRQPTSRSVVIPLDAGGEFDTVMTLRRMAPEGAHTVGMLIEGRRFETDDPTSATTLLGRVRYRAAGADTWTNADTSSDSTDLRSFGSADSKHRRIFITLRLRSAPPARQYEVELLVSPLDTYERYLIRREWVPRPSNNPWVAQGYWRPIYGYRTTAQDADDITAAMRVTSIYAHVTRPQTYADQHTVSLAITPSGSLGASRRYNALVTRQVDPAPAATALGTNPALLRQWARSSNPALLYADFALGRRDRQGRLLWGAGLTGTEIDWASINAWKAFCDTESLECNAVLRDAISAAEALTRIAQCGRASPSWTTGKLGVVWDAPRPVTCLVTPANIIAGTFVVEYLSGGDLADEIELEFTDKDDEWRTGTVRATTPGTAAVTRTEKRRLWGVTNRAQALKEAYRQAAKQAYHRRIYRWEMDWEGLAVARGDVVLLTHDLTQPDAAGRFTHDLTQPGTAAAPALDVLVLPTAAPVTSASTYVLVQRPDGEITTHAIAAAVPQPPRHTRVSITPPLPPFGQDHELEDYRWTLHSPADIHAGARKVKIVAIEPLSADRVRLMARDERDEYYAYASGAQNYTWDSLTSWDDWGNWNTGEAA